MSYVVAAYFVAKPAHRDDFRKAIVAYNRISPLAPGA